MLSNNCSILLIDDDADVLDAYTQLLEQAGYHVSACNNPFDAREQVPKDWPGIVLSDVCMPGCSGIDLMTLFHQDDDLLPILLITGHGDVPMAVEAVKKGAWDFLQKPIDPGKLLTLVDAALRQRQSVIARRQYCQQKLQVELIGRSQWTVRYRQRLQQLAETDIAVWLYGEPGTGRMTGARYLHQLGRHAEGPFIACELTLTVVDYDEMWPALFENERTLLQMTLGKVISRIHHIGSTSVPGLSAKPVIDILIEVANLEELDSLNQAMEGVGYTVRGENGILNRRYFTKGGNQRSHHIHAFATGDAQIIKHLAFRDYLIKHNDVAIQYALMKKSAMLLCENDSHRYSIYKADFIQKHLRMALIDAGHLG